MERRNRLAWWVRLGFVAGFMVVLTCVLAGTLWQWKQAAAIGMMPAWSKDWTGWPTEFGRRFVASHAGRLWGQRAVAVWKWERFDSARWRSDLVRGREGWLFFRGEDARDPLAMERGAFQWGAGEVAEIVRRLTVWRDWLEERGIRFVMVVPPNKVSVHGEKGPDWLDRVGEGDRAAARLVEAMRVAGLPVVDVGRELRERSGERDWFYRTDTHWNAWGAYEGYRMLLEDAVMRGLGLEPVGLEEGEWWIDADWMGDLAHPIADREGLREERWVVVLPGAESYEEPGRALYAPVRLLNEAVGEEGLRMFAVGDSFFFGMEPYLYGHFREIDFWWSYDYAMPGEVIERLSPDVVVLEVLERMLPMLREMGLPPGREE